MVYHNGDMEDGIWENDVYIGEWKQQASAWLDETEENTQSEGENTDPSGSKGEQDQPDFMKIKFNKEEISLFICLFKCFFGLLVLYYKKIVTV